jgi:hypothetical protein
VLYTVLAALPAIFCLICLSVAVILVWIPAAPAMAVAMVHVISSLSCVHGAHCCADLAGTWRLIWSQQAENASPLQKWGTKQSRNYQIIDVQAGTLENVVDLGFSQVRAQATCAALGDDKTDVVINGAGLQAGPVRVPLGIKGTGFVEWLYLDDTMRVTKGSKGSLFVHVRDDDALL